MRMLHLAEVLAFGGLETHLLALCRALAGLGHHPYLYARLMTAEFLEQAEELGIPHLAGGGPGERLAAYIRANGIQVLHAHPVAIPLAVSLGRTLGLPLAATYHGFFGWSRESHGDLGRIICVSREVHDTLAGADPGLAPKLVVIQNGIDVERFRPLHETRGEGRRVLFIGRLDQDKYHALKVVFEALRSLPGVELEVAGSGPYLDQLRSEAPAEVRWLGYVRDMVPVINGADVVIGTGRGVREAMACGVPAIALDAGGYDGPVTPESIEALEYGNFMGRSGRPLAAEALRRDLESILGDARARERIGAWSRRHAEDRYAITPIAIEHLLVYSELINRRREGTGASP